MIHLTLGDARNTAFQLIDMYSVDGRAVEHVYAGLQDYARRVNFLANDAQVYLATSIAKLPARLTVIQKPAVNLLHNILGVIYLNPGEECSYAADSAKAFYAEVMPPVSIEVSVRKYIEYETVYEETVTGAGFKAVSARLADTEGKEVKITFTAAGPAAVKNLALYGDDILAAGAVPAFAPYTTHAMPADFYKLMDDRIDGLPAGSYKWTADNRLLIESSLEGMWEVNYYRYPGAITCSTPDEHGFEVAREAQNAIPYYIAAHLVQTENPGLYAALLNEFEVKISRITGNTPPEILLAANEKGW